MEQRAIAPEQLTVLLKEAGGDDGKAAEIARDRAVISPQKYLFALQACLEEELLDLFFWDGAEVRLIEGQPPDAFYSDGFSSASCSCDVPTLVESIFARIDEWTGGSGRLPSNREVYEIADRSVFLPMDFDRFGEALDLMDGSRTIGHVLSESGLRRVPTYRFVMDGVHAGGLRRVPRSAAAKVSREHYMKEVAQLEAALRVSLAPAIVRGRLARALESAGEKARAADQWRTLGNHFRKENNLKRALQNYERCVRLLPTDFATRELILEIHRHRREFGALVADGRPLADLFLKHNLLNRAKLLLLQLVGIEEEDTGLRRQLIMVLIGLGEKELALKHLWVLAKVMDERGAGPAEMRDVLLRILALDPDQTRARKRLDQITGLAAHRKLIWGTVAATVLLLVSMASAYGYEAMARRSLRDAMDEANALIGADNYAAAQELLEESLTRFKWSRSRKAAQELLDRIKEIRTELARRSNRDQRLTEMIVGAGAEEAARSLAERALALLEAGRTEEGHRVYRELFELYPWLEDLDTAGLPLRLEVLPADARVYLSARIVLGTNPGRPEGVP